MLVHFPTALLLMDWVCTGLFFVTRDDTFLPAALYAGTGGVAIGWLAMTFGLLDLVRISPEREKALKTAMWHGGINSLVVVIFTFFVYLDWKAYPEWNEPALIELIVKSSVLLLLAGNYLGGELVLKYHAGTNYDTGRGKE